MAARFFLCKVVSPRVVGSWSLRRALSVVAASAPTPAAGAGTASPVTTPKLDAAQVDRLKEEKLLKGKNAYLSGIRVNGTTRRFYVSVGVEEVEDGFAVKLGHQYIMTQGGHRLVVPTASLAEMIAIEWDSQVEFIRPSSMPLNKLAVTAIDQMATEKGRQRAIGGLLNQLRSDATLHRASAPALLVKLQRKHHDPLLDFIRETHGIELKLARGIEMVEQSVESMERFGQLLARQNHWVLAVLDNLASFSNSLVIPWTLFAGRVSLEQAFEAARCDENYQIRQYGELRGLHGHGVDIEYARQQLAAGRTFLNLLEEHGAFRTEGGVVTPFEYEHRPPTPAALSLPKYRTLGELQQARKERAEQKRKNAPLEEMMRQAMRTRMLALREALMEGKDPLASRLEDKVNTQLEEYDSNHPTRRREAETETGGEGDAEVEAQEQGQDSADASPKKT